MRIGTSYFVSRHSALRYYASQEVDATLAMIDRKIADGEIHIGKPDIGPWQRLVVIDHGTRYAIEEEIR